MENSSRITELASKGYLTLNKAAPILGISYPTILKYKEKGWIKTLQVGGQYRIYEDEFLYLLKYGIAKKHYTLRNEEREGNNNDNGS